MTVPFGLADVTVATAGSSFAARIAATALERSCPTTSGTRTRPRETRIDTTEPFATRVPAVGLWETTLPECFEETTLTVWAARPRLCSAAEAAEAFMPLTFGTVTIALAETVSVIVEPFSTRECAGGSSLNTVPDGKPLGLVAIRATRPACLSRAIAVLCFCRTTFGTVTTGAFG